MSSQAPRQDYPQSHLFPSTSRQPLAPSYSTTQRLRPPSIPPSHTLPPLSQDYSYTFPNDPRSQISSQQYLPNNPAHPNQNASFQFQSQNYPPSGQSYQSPTNYSPQSWSSQPSTTQSYQYQNPPVAHRGLPSLLPMPNGHQQNTFFQQPPGSQFDPPQSHPQQTYNQSSQQQQPIHVVGSQGRRGILPSALGRPPAAVTDGASGAPKAAPVPVKDSEGKFPCEHCNKNYLHAKHLKRHMLRHTGQRPYSCGLCEDTFSRSDILKRHFQKCSVRRGNPTGASHLTHSRANKKGKPNPVEQLSIPLANAATSVTSAPSSQPSQKGTQSSTSTPTIQSPYELQGLGSLGLGTAAYQEELQNFSARASRANSIKRSSNGMTINSRTGSGPNSVGGPDSAFSYSTGQVTPDSLTTSGAATPYSVHQDGRLPFSPNGNYHSTSDSGLELNNISRPHSGPAHMAGNHPHIMGSANGSRQDLDLTNLFPSNGHDDFQQQYPAHPEETHHHTIKSESDFHYPYTNYISK